MALIKLSWLVYGVFVFSFLFKGTIYLLSASVSPGIWNQKTNMEASDIPRIAHFFSCANAAIDLWYDSSHQHLEQYHSCSGIQHLKRNARNTKFREYQIFLTEALDKRLKSKGTMQFCSTKEESLLQCFCSLSFLVNKMWGETKGTKETRKPASSFSRAIKGYQVQEKLKLTLDQC